MSKQNNAIKTHIRAHSCYSKCSFQALLYFLNTPTCMNLSMQISPNTHTNGISQHGECLAKDYRCHFIHNLFNNFHSCVCKHARHLTNKRNRDSHNFGTKNKAPLSTAAATDSFDHCASGIYDSSINITPKNKILWRCITLWWWMVSAALTRST